MLLRPPRFQNLGGLKRPTWQKKNPARGRGSLRVRMPEAEKDPLARCGAEQEKPRSWAGFSKYLGCQRQSFNRSQDAERRHTSHGGGSVRVRMPEAESGCTRKMRAQAGCRLGFFDGGLANAFPKYPR